MNLDAIADFSFVRPLAPLLLLLLVLGAALPFLPPSPERERLFFAALGLFFFGASAVFLLMGQPLAALSVFFFAARLYGVFRKAERKNK